MRDLRYSLALWERWQPKADGEGERLRMTRWDLTKQKLMRRTNTYVSS